MVHIALLLSFTLAQQSSVSHYWHKITDRTFSGIYHANAFDLAMMIPYFLVLCILALYGLHRYWLLYDLYKYFKNVPGPPPPLFRRPPVTIQLPIFNARYLIDRACQGVGLVEHTWQAPHSQH